MTSDSNCGRRSGGLGAGGVRCSAIFGLLSGENPFLFVFPT